MIIYVPQDIHDRLNWQLKSIPEKIPDVLRKTINSTARTSRKNVQDEVNNKYLVKARGFNKEMRIEYATVKNMQATIETKGSPIALYQFKIKKNTAASAAQAQVMTSSRLKELTLKGGETNGKDLKAFVQKMKNGHYGVFRRLSGSEKEKVKKSYDDAVIKNDKTKQEAMEKRLKSRYIKQLYGLSVPQMVGNDEVQKIVQDAILNQLRSNLDKHIEEVLGGR